MLSIFRTNQLVANALLIIYAAILRCSVFWVPSELEVTSSGVLGTWFVDGFSESTLLSYLLGVLLVSFQALLINIIISRYRTASELSLFPGLFYILIASSMPEFLNVSPALVANTFYILALMELFGTYKKYEVANHLFNAGFWASVGFLCYFSHIFLLLLAFVATSILRAFRIKEALMILIGFAVPYILSIVWYFWVNKWGLFWQHQVIENSSFLDISNLQSNADYYLRIVFFLLITLVCIFSFRLYTFKKKINVQKNINILYWGLFLAMTTFLYQANIKYNHLLLFAVPLGILLSMNFIKMKSSTAEVLHLLLFIGVLLAQFSPLFLS